MKRAFALTELLVVTAIVAILATILFPVLSATSRAKQQQTGSNIRQVALSTILYGSDWDDGIPLSIAGKWRSLQNVRDGQLTKYGEQRSDGWPLLITPYIRTRSLFVEPSRGDPHGIWSGQPLAEGALHYDAERNTYRNQSRFPMFGMNYLYLSPLCISAQGMASDKPTDMMEGEGHLFVEADDPSGTVLFTQSFRGYIPKVSADMQGVADVSRGFFVVNAPALWAQLSGHDIPYVILWTGTQCSGDWCGQVHVGESTQRRTNFVYPGNSSAQTNVAFLDGHCRFMTDAQLADGTSYLIAEPHDDSSGYFGGGAEIIDKNRYLWNLTNNYYGG